MDFLEDPPFPGCPSFGFTSEPIYRVTVIETSGGHERRNRHWSRPRHLYTATVGPRTEGDVADLLDFYHAVGGQAYGFRFFDWVDHLSCQIDETPAATDQLLVAEDGGGYQMVKDYTAGALTQRRDIQKPISGTILIADNGTPKVEGADYTIDYTSGIVTLGFSPSGDLSWGGQFHVPVRFASSLPVEIQNKRIHSASFQLKELRLTAGGEESGGES